MHHRISPCRSLVLRCRKFQASGSCGVCIELDRTKSLSAPVSSATSATFALFRPIQSGDRSLFTTDPCQAGPRGTAHAKASPGSSRTPPSLQDRRRPRNVVHPRKPVLSSRVTVPFSRRRPSPERASSYRDASGPVVLEVPLGQGHRPGPSSPRPGCSRLTPS